MTEPLIVTIPGLRLISEMNNRSHWRARKKRFDGQKDLVMFYLTKISSKRRRQFATAKRVNLKLVRVIGPRGRRFDRDNAAGAFKAILDAVCGWLEKDDGDEVGLGLEWAQEKGPDHGVRIELTVPDVK